MSRPYPDLSLSVILPGWIEVYESDSGIAEHTRELLDSEIMNTYTLVEALSNLGWIYKRRASLAASWPRRRIYLFHLPSKSRYTEPRNFALYVRAHGNKIRSYSMGYYQSDPRGSISDPGPY